MSRYKFIANAWSSVSKIELDIIVYVELHGRLVSLMIWWRTEYHVVQTGTLKEGGHAKIISIFLYQ